jgi:hypothetical protein
MRGLLASAVALQLALAAPAFAQNAEPVLVDQGTAQPGSPPAGSPPADDASTALAQAPPGPFDNLTPWLVTGAVVGTIVTVAVVASQNNNNNNNVPASNNKSKPVSP